MSELWCMTCGYKRGNQQPSVRTKCPHGHGALTNAHLVADGASPDGGLVEDWPEWLRFGPVRCLVWDHEGDTKVSATVIGWSNEMHGEHRIAMFVTVGSGGVNEWLNAEPLLRLGGK